VHGLASSSPRTLPPRGQEPRSRFEEAEIPGFLGLSQSSDGRFDTPEQLRSGRKSRGAHANGYAAWPVPNTGRGNARYTVDELERSPKSRGKLDVRLFHLDRCTLSRPGRRATLGTRKASFDRMESWPKDVAAINC
jgi:hypothetical protein